jgi:hypothetical protein
MKKDKKINFKKIYFDLYYTSNYLYMNLKEKNINRSINDDDYYNLYNYKEINRREIEEPFFMEENEKYYYNYLKIFFLKENFYDIFIQNYYIENLNYTNFIKKLKHKLHENKYKKQPKKLIFRENIFFTDFNANILQIKNDLLNNSFLKK